jgi:F-type H+-transporting ATPase subunit delta
MTTRTSATRYARALLDVLLKESTAEQGAEDLARVSALVQQFPELQRAFTNPVIPASRKRALVAELLPKLSLSAPVGKLLLMLAERDRLVLLPDLIAVYQERLEELHKVVRAEVTSAEPLSPERLSALQTRLASATGRTVKVTTRVDPAIIGGVKAQIGSTVYDGSIATQLETFRQKLESAV